MIKLKISGVDDEILIGVDDNAKQLATNFTQVMCRM